MEIAFLLRVSGKICLVGKFLTFRHFLLLKAIIKNLQCLKSVRNWILVFLVDLQISLVRRELSSK